jgi:hypothetical protein
MVKYRKKQIVIDAEQWWPDDHPQKPEGALPESAFPDVRRWDEKPCYGEIDTLEGKHVVTPSDWIIIGIEGEKYPCKDRVFKKTYELVEEEDIEQGG